jgi:hypothetical protein
MEIPLYIHGNMYDRVTLESWQYVWDHICKMAYEGKNVVESIVTRPGVMYIDGVLTNEKKQSEHSKVYRNKDLANSYFLNLDNVWKQYSQFYGPVMPKVIPEFKELIVPYALYDCLGVQSWFRHSFPNCKVFYWDE